MRQLDIPNGLEALGYTDDDLDSLVSGALPQHRVLKLSPRPVGAPELKQIFADSMKIW